MNREVLLCGAVPIAFVAVPFAIAALAEAVDASVAVANHRLV